MPIEPMPSTTVLTDLVPVRHPVVSAPMGGVAGGALAAAVSNAGGLGLVGGGGAEADWLARELSLVSERTEETGRPWGVGFLTWADGPEAINQALSYRPSAVMLSFGEPGPHAARVRDAGSLLLVQVTDIAEAERALRCRVSHPAPGPRRGGMTVLLRRTLLVLMALAAAYVGIWAYFMPRSWYASFPGFGLHWLPVLGPYNEHLSRDVGALYLGLLALSLGAWLRAADSFVVRLAGAAWLVFSVPHLVYHLRHLDMYAGVDRPLNVTALAFFVVAGAALLLPVRSPNHPYPRSGSA